MRSFGTLFVFLICAFEIVLAIPAPLPAKSKAVAKKSGAPVKKVPLSRGRVTKKVCCTLLTHPITAQVTVLSENYTCQE